ncbi:MAG: hypothetical protein AAF517_07060 [Planctomycetota bacterium]
MLLSQEDISRAVDIQRKSYRLLRWMQEAFDRGFIAPEDAGSYASNDEAVLAWIDKHYENFPSDARPGDRDHIEAFSRFFATYLVSTFDLDANPKERLDSFEAHCFCPICSWLVRRPYLETKKVRSSDKKVAARLKRTFLVRLSEQMKTPISGEAADKLVVDGANRESIGMCTYVSDVLQRMQGFTVGAASLVLWRSFAWTETGAPKKKFELRAKDVVIAQDALVECVRNIAAAQ